MSYRPALYSCDRCGHEEDARSHGRLPELWAIVEEVDDVLSDALYLHTCEECTTEDEAAAFLVAGFDAHDEWAAQTNEA